MLRTKGFSLVELLVGMAIGLLGIMVVTTVLTVNNTIQAKTAAAGESQSMGNLALYTVERDVKQAGYGLATPTLLGCNLRGTDNVRGTALAVDGLAPVTISEGASADLSDQVTVVYGTSELRMSSSYLLSSYDGGSGDIELINMFGFKAGDFFMLGKLPEKSTCVLGRVTATNVATSKISHISTGVNGRYNKSAGEGVAFSGNNVGEIFNMGPDFRYLTYKVVYCPSNTYSSANCRDTPDDTHTQNLLVQESFLTGNVLVVAERVQAFKARYGHDSNGDGTVDTWDTTEPTSSADWTTTSAIQMGLAIKDAVRATDAVSPSTLSLWHGGPSVTLSAEDQHYRYKTYSVIVPLRNMIWRTF